MRRKGNLSLIFIMAAAVVALVGTLVSGNSPQLGLDLQGGVSVVLQPKGKANAEDLKQTIEIIRQRVDGLGVAEPEITRQGSSVVVQLPGVKNQRRALEIVGDTAELRFRPVLQAAPGDITTQTTAAPAGDASSTTTTTVPTTDTSESGMGLGVGETAGGAPDSTTTTIAPTSTTAPTATTAPPQDQIKITSREDDDPTQQVVLQGHDSKGVVEETYILGPSLLTGEALESAAARLDPTAGKWSVSVVFKGGAKGIDVFNKAAALCFGKAAECPSGRLAIVLDSEVQSAPTIQDAKFARDQIQITGDFTEKEAKDLALVLRYGALPIELEPVTQQTVSASLGKDSLHAGIIAGLVGLLLVALYMILYYRALGLVVILGLGVWSSLNFSIISFLGETQGLALSLAGVTGIIVSIGVTVDSYVVFFERLKDEVHAGRTLRSSTERAFARAFRTILAADISSFIGAALLYWLTVGPVRGFAFFLGLSTILDVITAYFFTRPLVAILGRNRVFTEARFLGVARSMGRVGPLAASAGGGR